MLCAINLRSYRQRHMTFETGVVEMLAPPTCYSAVQRGVCGSMPFEKKSCLSRLLLLGVLQMTEVQRLVRGDLKQLIYIGWQLVEQGKEFIALSRKVR